MTTITSRQVGPVGLGLMGMTWRPQQTADEQAFAAMKAAIAGGATFWSSGEFYGYPEPTMNLQLLNRYFTKYPEDAGKVTLFVKGGSDLKTLYPKCSAADIKASVANSIRILAGTKKIDVFGPARIDHSVPIEETIGALAELVDDGTIGGIGLSEASAATIERAHKVHPLALIEVEFSLWSTEVLSNGVAQTAKKLEIPIVAYSPLGRGFLTGQIKSPSDIPQGDIRLYFDRFQPEVGQPGNSSVVFIARYLILAQNFSKNLDLVEKIKAIASKKGVSNAQLALAWIKGWSNSGPFGNIIPIPGATAAQQVEENTASITLTAAEKDELDRILNTFKVSGGRYNAQLEGTLWG